MQTASCLPIESSPGPDINRLLTSRAHIDVLSLGNESNDVNIRLSAVISLEWLCGLFRRSGRVEDVDPCPVAVKRASRPPGYPRANAEHDNAHDETGSASTHTRSVTVSL